LVLTQTDLQKEKKNQSAGFALGIFITFIIAFAARYLSQLPYLSIMGQLVIAILLGVFWRATIGVPGHAMAGAHFSSKKLLRFGIILLGMRLNWRDMLEAGPKVILIASISILFGFFAVYGFGRLIKVERNLGLLTASGTAICGAAAIVAIAPQIKAKDEETAVSVAAIAILGTLFTLVYTLIYPYLGLSVYQYGLFSGATLHEIAHVIAASDPGGPAAVDIAVIVKLTRVALLVPVAILLGLWVGRIENAGEAQEKRWSLKTLPIPWFILGFLAMSGVNSLGILSSSAASALVLLAYLLIAMAMAGLGLNVNLSSFGRMGVKPLAAGLIGSILLSILGFGMVFVLQL
jgi:uncharacterized integral membrane protein (TIGR00698 family)